MSHESESIDPLQALERLLAGVGSSDLESAMDASRKLVRIHAKQSRSRSDANIEKILRIITARAQPGLPTAARDALVADLAHTFRVWAR